MGSNIEVKSVKKEKKNGGMSKAAAKKAAKEEMEKKDKKVKGKKAKAEKKPKKDALAKKKPELIVPLSEAEKKDLAPKHDARFRELEKEIRQDGTEMMVILRDMKHHELYKYVKSEKTGNSFKSFEQWLNEASPVQKSSGYAMLKVADKLLPYISKEELEQIPVRNRNLLTKIPRMKFDKPGSPIREAAKGSESQLRAAIAEHAPEVHIEEKIKFEIDKSANPIIAEVILAVKEMNEIKGSNGEANAEALEYLCLEWKDSPSVFPDFAGMNNWDAYQAWKQQRNAGEAASDLEEAG